MGFEIKLKSCCLSWGCENPTEASSEVGFCLLLTKYMSSAGWGMITRRWWATKCVLPMGMETCAKVERRAQQRALAVAFANISPACLAGPRGLCRDPCYQRVLGEHRGINCKRLDDIKSKHNCFALSSRKECGDAVSDEAHLVFCPPYSKYLWRSLVVKTLLYNSHSEDVSHCS